jgi:hypothetical protein
MAQVGTRHSLASCGACVCSRLLKMSSQMRQDNPEGKRTCVVVCVCGGGDGGGKGGQRGVRRGEGWVRSLRTEGCNDWLPLASRISISKKCVCACVSFQLSYRF